MRERKSPERYGCQWVSGGREGAFVRQLVKCVHHEQEMERCPGRDGDTERLRGGVRTTGKGGRCGDIYQWMQEVFTEPQKQRDGSGRDWGQER